MAYKYSVCWVMKDGRTNCKTFTAGKTIADIEDKALCAAPNEWELLEYDVYNARGVLLISKRWNSSKGRFVSQIRKKQVKKTEKVWHPFGL